MSKKRILMIGSDSSVKGGITSVITQLLNYDWNKKNIEMRFMPTYIDGGKFKSIIFFIKAYVKFIYLLITYKPEILHIHMSHNGSFYRKYIIHKTCKIFNKKDVIHLHSSSFKEFYSKSTEKNKRRIKKFFSECDLVFVLGKKWEKNILDIQPDTNTVILNNAVKIPQIYDTYNHDGINILFLGVLIKRKGVNDLLKAAANLHKNNLLEKYNIKFKIGGVGKEFENLKSYVENNELDKYIEFLGWIDNDQKQNHLLKSDIFVLPSYNEGLPIAILEAISYGLPVISTKVGSIDEAVIENYNGYLTEPGDIKELEQKLIKIIKDKELLNILSENSRKLAVEKFDENLYFDKLKDIYNSL